MFKSAKFATTIMLINATAVLFSHVLTDQQLPRTIMAFVTSHVSSKLTFFIYFCGVVLVIGMFMESFSATIIFAPLLKPIAMEYIDDPVQFGIVLMVGWAIGYITPPFGVNLFVSCSITGVSIREVTPYLIPMIASMLVVLFIVSAFPQVFMWLPEMVR